MKEVTFIRRNIDKWRQAEKTIETASAQSPDRLADVYVDITSDLAFAQTHYPRSRITLYLNNLASALHNTLYRNKREKWSRILTFWHTEVPLAVYGARRELLCSFLVFAASVLIGVVSQLGDPEFVRLILGDEYVEMTLRNIAEGDPMAVYKGGDEGSMFLGITINNVRVSFLCFAAGLFTSVGTGWLLLTNGVMVDIGHRHRRGGGHRHGQRMALPGHVSASRVVPHGGPARHENRHGHGARVRRGGLHRGLPHAPHRGARRPAPAAHHPFRSFHRILLYLFT